MHLEPIETQRLTIRPFQPDDGPAVYEYMSDLAVIAYLPEGQFSAAQAHEFIAKNSVEQAEALAVTRKGALAVIGHMVFHLWYAPRIYEIGWVFNQRYHGQGYATEAAYALLEYGFEVLQIHRVIATCQRENVPSYRVMEKLGMQREAHFRKCVDRGENQWGDEYLYALLEEKWFQGKGKSAA